MQTQSEPKLTKTELSMCRGIVYSALSIGFCPPRDETLLHLGTEEAAVALADALEPLDPEGRLSELALAIARAENARSLDGLRDSHLTFFGHTARGLVPPYETEYGTDAPFLQPQEMSDIGGFMGAFGLVLDPNSHQRIDHISCECAFMSFLCNKEVYAFDQRDSETLATTREAERRFLRDHLGRFAVAFGRDLERKDPGGFYGALGALCAAFIVADGLRLNVAVGPGHCELRPTTFNEPPMACATCPEAGGQQTEPGFEFQD